MIEKILIFVAFLCPLIFFHELGHFLFARLFGVRVEVFSLGFGPKILKFVRGGTQYALSIIPLGGYIKMFGDDPLSKEEIPEAERKYSFTHKGKWARFWIVFGGPLANFIFAFFLFFSLLLVGEKVPEARFGSIDKSSKFYEMGLRTGDVLMKINGEEVLGFTDLAIAESSEKISSVTVSRLGELKTFETNIVSSQFVQDFFNLSPRFRRPIFVDSKGKTYVLSFTQGQFKWETSLEEMAEREFNGSAYLYEANYKKSEGGEGSSLEEKDLLIDFQKERAIALQFTGSEELYRAMAKQEFWPVDLMVSSIVMGSPADSAGLKRGDVITHINGQEVFNFEDLRREVQKANTEKESEITYMREGKINKLFLTPQITTNGDEKIHTIGVYSSGEYLPLRYVEGRPKGFFESIILASERTWDTIVKTLDGFKKLVTNEVSIKSMGGPLAIGKVASDSLNVSLSYFFKIMALISINLGIINLFPIPVLDGGHILFIFLEIVNRGPLSRRKMELAQQFGLSLLLVLIFLALFNDISRLF